MKNLTMHEVHNNNYELKTTIFEGEASLVVPVVMMTEGVRSGSGGPILHLAENMAPSAASWNGAPVVINHPKKNGRYISAKETPDLHIGKIYDARMEGGKLKGNAYVNVQRLAAIAPHALQAIQNKEPLEVSIGVVNDIREQQGEYEGVSYSHVATAYIPDHLAILPGQKGACSWEDGCGIRVNEALTVCDAIKHLTTKGFNVGLVNAGYKEIAEAAMTKLSASDTENEYYYLEEIYDDALVYGVRNTKEKTLEFYRVAYSYDDNNLSFSGEPEKVKKETSYMTLQRTEVGSPNPSINTKNEKTMSKEKVNAIVDALIANKHTRFDDTDKEFLSGLTKEQLDKLEPVEQEPLQVNREDALKVLNLKKSEDYVALMPESMREKVEEGIKLYEKHRDDMVKVIVANTSEWEEKELEGMETSMLEKLTKTVTSKKNYAGAGVGNLNANRMNGEEEELLLPVDDEPKKEEGKK